MLSKIVQRYKNYIDKKNAQIWMGFINVMDGWTYNSVKYQIFLVV
jgi:hypothetical protein